jgi:hypothetical protein
MGSSVRKVVDDVADGEGYNPHGSRPPAHRPSAPGDDAYAMAEPVAVQKSEE